MNNAPIGVFDSGLGGLTAVRELKNVLPNENIIYFGDTGRVPYGTRSNSTIKHYARQDSKFLLKNKVKMIIAACGTVSSVATNLKYDLPVPYTGVVSPTCFAAAKKTKNKKVGVIGTSATINSHSYRNLLKEFDSGIETFEQDCPLFVPLVENGFIDKDDEVVRLVIERYMTDIKNAGVDTVILGCTHYPIIKDAISSVMGEGVELIDSGKETAIYAAKILKENNLLADRKENGDCEFYVSDAPDGFENIANVFLGENVSHKVEQINIELY
ncbi:MAG: glutamate racemase [Ruminococcus sp.]|nr:glutamate racemase [Ruminococcus sp.]